MCVCFLPGCPAHLQYLPDHSDAHARGCVRTRVSFCTAFYTKNVSFYQDRLGTYIGKALKKGRVSVGVLRSPSVGARYGRSAAAAATAVAGAQSSGAAAVAVVVGGGGDDGSPVPTVGFVTGMPGSVMEAGESKVRREREQDKTRNAFII